MQFEDKPANTCAQKIESLSLSSAASKDEWTKLPPTSYSERITHLKPLLHLITAHLRTIITKFDCENKVVQQILPKSESRSVSVNILSVHSGVDNTILETAVFLQTRSPRESVGQVSTQLRSNTLKCNQVCFDYFFHC